MRLTCFLVASVLLASPAAADDGAASIAAGGLVLMKREPRIVMAKEVLRIGPRKVVVDYGFRNDSDQDIDTAVAFPIAPYTFDDYFWAHEQAFNQLDSRAAESRIKSFRLYVQGKPQSYRVEARALFHGHDYGPMLRGMKVDPVTFGHIPEEEMKDDFDSLAPQQKNQLIQLGLLSKDNSHVPQWKVEVRYYWIQHFPAHQIVHIRHEYIPISGEIQVPPHYLPGQKHDAAENDTAIGIQQTLAKTCVSSAATKRIYQTLVARPVHETRSINVEDSTREWFRHLLVLDWVDFILTTANTWKQPIEDFTLIVDRKPYRNEPAVSAYFCGDGPLAAGDGSTTIFHARNFIPTKDLMIGFYRY